MTRRKQTTTSISLICFGLLLCTSAVNAQFDVEAYQNFLEQNENLTADGLLANYPADRFFDSVTPVDFERAEFWNMIDAHFSLTTYEKALLEQHGFVATERVTYPSFGRALADIYHADLPVYVSSDALLHALHMSYDAILIEVEL